MTPEALLVHYADDLDAKFHMLHAALRDDATPGPLTSKKNVLGQRRQATASAGHARHLDAGSLSGNGR
ncbi:MAG TPA: hypothetical protein VND64_19725 [Pirellulales bacterium]|nr:hypothetical protein [Pirellulales bacterium]